MQKTSKVKKCDFSGLEKIVSSPHSKCLCANLYDDKYAGKEKKELLMPLLEFNTLISCSHAFFFQIQEISSRERAFLPAFVFEISFGFPPVQAFIFKAGICTLKDLQQINLFGLLVLPLLCVSLYTRRGKLRLGFLRPLPFHFGMIFKQISAQKRLGWLSVCIMCLALPSFSFPPLNT